MSNLVTPLEPCHECKTLAACREVHPPPRLHSGWECTNCDEVRWGGVTLPGGPRPIGYSFAGGFFICWRCHRLHTMPAYVEDTGPRQSLVASNYPRLGYLSGCMMTLYTDDKEPFERSCDECGERVTPDL